MDQIRWWADFLSSELDDTATVEYEALSPGVGGSAPARVTITPRRKGAMSLRVSAGGGEVSRIEFDTVADQLCVGVPSRAGLPGLDSANQLGVLVAAAVADGAALYRQRLGRQVLIVGLVDRHPESKRFSSVASWLPYAESHEPTSLFRRSPDYDQLPSAAFVVSAFPSWKRLP